jgi:hypothetical protein
MLSSWPVVPLVCAEKGLSWAAAKCGVWRETEVGGLNENELEHRVARFFTRHKFPNPEHIFFL